MRNPNEKPVRQMLKDLEVGGVFHLPIEHYTSAKVMASTYGPMWRKVFSTHLDRKTRTFSVTRIS
jgi:hypothetical protein